MDYDFSPPSLIIHHTADTDEQLMLNIKRTYSTELSVSDIKFWILKGMLARWGQSREKSNQEKSNSGPMIKEVRRWQESVTIKALTFSTHWASECYKHRFNDEQMTNEAVFHPQWTWMAQANMRARIITYLNILINYYRQMIWDVVSKIKITHKSEMVPHREAQKDWK